MHSDLMQHIHITNLLVIGEEPVRLTIVIFFMGCPDLTLRIMPKVSSSGTVIGVWLRHYIVPGTVKTQV